MALLEALHITMRYSALAQPVLDDVSLTVGRGELIAIVGSSGSGKSTLLHVLAGLESPTAGTVRVDGLPLYDADERTLAAHRRGRSAIVFQSLNLLPTLTAEENVMLPLELGGTPRRDARAVASTMLHEVGLAHRARAFPALMSGGEMQRVAIARALAQSPSVIFADEPTGSLDTATAERVLSLLVGVRSSERTVIIVTHDERIAERADRVVKVKDGRLEDGQRHARSEISGVSLRLGKVA